MPPTATRNVTLEAARDAYPTTPRDAYRQSPNARLASVTSDTPALMHPPSVTPTPPRDAYAHLTTPHPVTLDTVLHVASLTRTRHARAGEPEPAQAPQATQPADDRRHQHLRAAPS